MRRAVPIVMVMASLIGLRGSLAPADGQALTAQASCAPTHPDLLGPYYKPNAPMRSMVGSGHVLLGTVRSASGCAPIAGARIEFWLTGPGGVYTDDHRATVMSGARGQYRFESSFPAPYPGASPHIHVRVRATGYRALATRYFPKAGQTVGRFDLVLVPVR